MDDIYAIRKIIGQKIRTRSLNIVKSLEREILCVKNDIIINNINLVTDIDIETFNNIKSVSFY